MEDTRSWKGNSDTCAGCNTDLKGKVSWVTRRVITTDGTWTTEGDVFCGPCFNKKMWASPSATTMKQAEKTRPLPPMILPP